VEVNKVIHDTLALLEHQFKVSKVKVEQNLAPELPMIYGNTGKLQQVFLNLFLNARDAMPGGGTLHVTSGGEGGVHISVADTGTGIASALAAGAVARNLALSRRAWGRPSEWIQKLQSQAEKVQLIDCFVQNGYRLRIE
jgi:light-regulated signal transduction histidine kinase (bacteriophytochrome)